MSWNMNVSKAKGTDFLAAVDAATPNGQGEPDVIVERDRQVAAAKAAIRELIRDRALGDEREVSFVANVYGHANPDFKARDGWANDTITVTVSQAT